MEHIACRNCGNENVYFDTKDNKVVHYDCLDCNYKWSAPPVRVKRVLFNIVAGVIGVLLMMVGLSVIIAGIEESFSAQSPLIITMIGMVLTIIFSFRFFRTYRVIKK